MLTRFKTNGMFTRDNQTKRRKTTNKTTQKCITKPKDKIKRSVYQKKYIETKDICFSAKKNQEQMKNL